MTDAVLALDAVATALEASLPGAVERAAPFARLTTYQLGGPAAVLVRARHVAALAAVAGVVARHPVPILVVGRGSNLLVSDAGFPGVALLLEGELAAIDVPPASTSLRAGGGAALPVVARRAVAAGRGGLEFLVGIPGSVGGAVRMNAGGHGRQTADVLLRATVVDLADPAGTTRQMDAGALGLGYRTSNVRDTDVVVDVELDAPEQATAVGEAALDDIVRWRREHQPGGTNAGSVFANPPGDSAGRLIDALGLKGFRVGGAVVSPKHANFFQAEPGATADDVRRLVEEVRRRVADATGVVLELELRFVGFEERAPE